MRVTILTAGVAVALTMGPRTLAGQFPPDTLRNLKVFPANTPVRDLIGYMRNFAMSLGVRCQHCHVGEEELPLRDFDFVSDEKPQKQKARAMIRMVRAINEDHLSALPERSTDVTVQCMTCHRGLAQPRFLVDVLSETYATDGLAAAIRQYRELRARYYGTGSYDFSEGVLVDWAQQLAREDAYDDAIDVLELNLEQYAQSGQLHFVMGDVFRAKGDTSTAKGHYERAAELDARLEPGVARALQLMRRGR